MNLITDFLHHPILYGLLTVVGFGVLFLAVGFLMLPFLWMGGKLQASRCPQCKGFFKRVLTKWEVAGEREVLRTVNRVDQGVVYSNRLLEPNHAIEINRQEQVTFVQKTILNHWACKNPACGHQWQTEEVSEYEGSL